MPRFPGLLLHRGFIRFPGSPLILFLPFSRNPFWRRCRLFGCLSLYRRCHPLSRPPLSDPHCISVRASAMNEDQLSMTSHKGRSHSSGSTDLPSGRRVARSNNLPVHSCNKWSLEVTPRSDTQLPCRAAKLLIKTSDTHTICNEASSGGRGFDTCWRRRGSFRPPFYVYQDARREDEEEARKKVHNEYETLIPHREHLRISRNPAAGIAKASWDLYNLGQLLSCDVLFSCGSSDYQLGYAVAAVSA